MRSKFFSFLVLGLALLVAVPAFSQSEDEIVASFLKKTEKKKSKHAVGFFVLNGSYGRISRDNKYNYFAGRVTPLVTSTNGSSTLVDDISNTQEISGAIGFMTSRKTAVSLGFSYWLKLGSSRTGDFNLSLVNENDPNPHAGFDLKSEVKVIGACANFDYFLSNPPDKDGVLRKLAVKLTAGGGYYKASWQLWDGFAGYNLTSLQSEAVGGKLSGSAPGGNLGISAEYPINFGGLIMEGLLRYTYLNFTNMKWYNGSNQEVVATYNESGSRVDLNFSGPRVQLGFKRYFSW
jgi:hypothetical protein